MRDGVSLRVGELCLPERAACLWEGVRRLADITGELRRVLPFVRKHGDVRRRELQLPERDDVLRGARVHQRAGGQLQLRELRKSLRYWFHMPIGRMHLRRGPSRVRRALHRRAVERVRLRDLWKRMSAGNLVLRWSLSVPRRPRRVWGGLRRSPVRQLQLRALWDGLWGNATGRCRRAAGRVRMDGCVLGGRRASSRGSI